MKQKVQILVLTALEVERKAVIARLDEGEMKFHEETGTDYFIGVFRASNGYINIAIGRTDQTNVNAALETERAIAYFDPAYVFFVGVAGGLKDVSVGDIVIGTDVIGYERGKAKSDGFKFRPQFGASSYDMERAATAYSLSMRWKAIASDLVEGDFNSEISVFTGTIASGEKVDASYESELHSQVALIASHALAIEMEGLGFLRVCMTRPTIKSLLLRGISDLVNNKGEMDGKGSQTYASKNVSAFLFGLIETMDFPLDRRIEEPKVILFEIACKLYPRGVEDKGIWQRAGGDLSLINFNTSGKGQWVEALRLIQNGGGGDITYQSFLREMKVDFPHNSMLPDQI